MPRVPNLLLINPWIYDFAAHDLWAKPLGLLLLAGLLRARGYQVALLDCLDIHEPRMRHAPRFKPATRRRFGVGKFYRAQIPKPPALEGIARKYWRFGISPEIFEERLFEGVPPEVVLITSGMTYWYPGVQECIRRVKQHFPLVPVVLGGIYATLCPEHAARHSGADYIVTGAGERQVLELLARLTGCNHQKKAAENALRPFPCRPAFDLLGSLDYVCVLASRGCPFRCPYCASALLYPDFVQRQPLEVVDELQYWHKEHGVVDVAFYDDALLLNASRHILPLLAEVQRRRLALRFHTPNAMHLRPLTAEVCHALFVSGFKTLRLALESANPERQRQLGGKVARRTFSEAMAHLLWAGFLPEQIGVYLLCGLPNQDPAEVADSIRVVRDHGARPYLAEYSPIPGTALWEQAVLHSPFDLAAEPLYHNNSLLPCQSENFGLEELQWLKQLCRH